MAANQNECVPSLPKYLESLAADERKNYLEKLKSVSDIDPYNVSTKLYSDSIESWPEVEFPDISNYLIFATSCYPG